MYPTKNLTPGQRGPDVSQLQQFLLEQGHLTAEQIATGPGIYGPQTKNAVTQWQNANGVDNTSGPGYWGPRSISAASGLSGGGSPGTQAEKLVQAPANIDMFGLKAAVDRERDGAADVTDKQNLAYARSKNWISQYNAEIPQIEPTQPVETQETVDAEYAEAVGNNPVISNLAQGGSSVEQIMEALASGDLSGIVDFNGQPFSVQDQQDALAKGMEDNRLFYEAQQNKETADTEASLATQQNAYQDYLINSGQGFEADKIKSDKDAAQAGVLFSGGRVQREKNLERAYKQDQEAERRKVASNIGTTARDYQYKYGTGAAQGLNKYYNLGGNTYNPSVAKGGVSKSGLSSIYSPTAYDFQGTKQTERKATANVRAAGYLWNKGNKLLKTGNTNQY